MRRLGLPLLAVVLVVAVLGVQLAYGGATYEPLPSADPCAERAVDSQSEGIDGLTEHLVLVGVDNAACILGVSREAFVLDLAQNGEPTDAQVDALREGMLSAVGEMQDDGSLPPASELVDEALDQAELDGWLEALIRAIPDSVVDSALKTDDVLTRAIEQLDVRELLANVDDQEQLNAQVEAAVTQAVKDSLIARVQELIPG